MTDQEQDRKHQLDNWTKCIFASLPLLRPDEITIPFGPVLISLNSLNVLLSMEVLSVKFEFEDLD